MNISPEELIAQRVVIGFIEPVICTTKGHKEVVRARIDSGATNSSIDESLANKLGVGEIIGERTIRNAHGSTKRKIIEVTVTMAGRTLTEKFTIADRSAMRFPVLIGRNILRKGFLIDPNKKIRRLKLDN